MASFDLPDDTLFELAELDRLARKGVPYVLPPKSIADFVRIARAFLGWKQDTLASFARVSLSTIQRIERGDTVSAESLDRVASALRQKPDAFVKPRVPLTTDELEGKLAEWTERFKNLIPVPVRPLRTQPQIAKLARCHLFQIDGVQLGGTCQDEIAALSEILGFISSILMTEEGDSIVQIGRGEPIKRRQLYTMALDQVREIERRGYAVALAGNYQAQTGAAVLPTADVALIGFFPKLTDPAAIKRRILLAPARVNLADAWQRSCQSVDEDQANTSPAG